MVESFSVTDTEWAAMRADKHLANGLNVSDGKIRHEAVAEAFGYTFEAWN